MRPGEFARRGVRHIAWRSRLATARTVDLFRRGERTVIMTPHAGLRFGNWLYLWLDAHARTHAGEPTVVRWAPGMETWLAAFPALRALTVTTGTMTFHDRREWDDLSWHQRYGIDFTRAELDAFVHEVIAPEIDPGPSHNLVINVRRGDYYSDPGHRARYGFDQVGYLAESLRRIGASSRIVVVSDDPDWCRENLDQLLRGHAAAVTYDEQDPLANFRAICSAHRLIGTNSTFSYWGGYTVSALDPEATVVMPKFHGRLPTGSDAYQLDPHWTIVDGFADPTRDDSR